jgi:hypothetical protein
VVNVAAAPGDYVTTMRALWDEFYGPTAGAPSGLGIGNPAGLELERARRWSNVAAAMSAAMPLSTFLFLAPAGMAGTQEFLRSSEWHDRRPDRGLVFPNGPGLSAALAAFLRRWSASQETWIAELVRTECHLVEGTDPPGGLAPGVRAVVTGLDAPEYLQRLVAGRRTLPWDLLMAGSRPVARPVAALVLANGQHLILRDGAARQFASLCPYTGIDPAFAVEPLELGSALADRLVGLGALPQVTGAAR